MHIDIGDFDWTEIKIFAEENLDMIKIEDISLDLLEEKYGLSDFLEERGMDKLFLFYPNNSIRHESIYNRLTNNIDKVPLSELEALLDKYNCL